MTRDLDGRLVLPALWDSEVKHLLPNNYKLANSVLSGIQRKFSSQPSKLVMYNDVIQSYINNDILQVVDDLESLKDSNSVSFIAHSAVYRDEADTTKCRVVLLSNLCEKGSGNLSHNQISLPGPDLNSKLFVTCTLYRFNRHLLIYDLEKAFLQLGLSPDDCDKLHILWFRDVANGDYRRVALKFKRVPFGLRFSPALLMIALYVILVLGCENDSEDRAMCEMMYNLAYMDNIAFSAESEQVVCDSYEKVFSIFSSYCFNLQKFATNCSPLKSRIADCSSSQTDTKLFGMLWNTDDDTFRNKPCFLDPKAKTKREVLSALNANYDPLGMLIPIFNRAILFVRDLQAAKDLDWDTPIPPSKLKVWSKICKQCNRSNNLSITRYVGDYESNFDLVSCTDASKDFYGCVIYLRDRQTGKLSFVLAKNRTIPKQMQTKTIPVLELCAVDFGVTCVLDLYNDLVHALCPVKINDVMVLTDSSISLNWLAAKSLKSSKIERKGGKVINCLDRIVNNCKVHPINFKHIQ